MLRRITCAIAAAFLFAALPCFADWPVFHGPKGDNKSADTGLLKKWPLSGPRLLWSADFIGAGYSGVSIVGDRIYTSGNIGELAMVFCLDKDGNKIWEKDNGPAHTNSRTYPGTRSTPTVDGEFVYDASALGEVTCFKAKDGEKVWRRNLLKDYDASMPRWILGHSVVVDGDKLICMVGSEKFLSVALDKKTGETVLEFPAKQKDAQTSYMTPYFFEFEGIRVLSVMSNVTLEGYDAKTAAPLFTIPWKNFRTTNVTAPIYRDGHLFLSSGYEHGAKGFKLTKNPGGPPHTITATEQWYEKRFDNHHHGLILVGDHVYGTTSKGNWAAVHFLTGKIEYMLRPVGEQSSVHYADGLIYVLSQDSQTVTLWNPSPKEFLEVGRFQLPKNTSGKSWAHPVVCNGRLYLRHGPYLYCYDVKAK